MCKRNGVKELNNYVKEENMMVAKFSVMERWCHMLVNDSFWGKMKKKYHNKKWWLYVWIIIARIRLPLEKVVAMVPLCESKHWWYLALWWCRWYIAFYKLLVQC
jgi:hypothetical protein